MAGGEHFLDIEACRYAALKCALVHLSKGIVIRAQHDDRLHAHRMIDISGSVAVSLTDQIGFGGCDAGGQKCCYIQFLPSGEIFANHDDKFGIEHERQLHSRV